jgi:RNA polymerase sigma factor (sigma-70 family)
MPLLRLRSDEQLLLQFRAGNDEAFDVLHDRYRQRLFAYVRQMLSAGTRQDAEDVMQDVFVRAYGALRADQREMNVRAWLYRVAHNRCIDHLRRPVPPPAEVFEMSRKPLHDPVEEAQRREDLTRLVEDIGRLPDQQRSALLMRELDGMSYADLASALDVTVPAVKSLLVRARVGLVDSADARDADCKEIRIDLAGAYDRGVKASARARRHMRTCTSCREYRTTLRGMRRSFAALSPVGLGPLALGAKLIGAGGAGGGAAAGGTAAAGGGAASGAMAAGGGIAGVTACKVAAVVCTAAITAGGAVEANHIVREHRPAPVPARTAPLAHAAAPAPAPAPLALLSHPRLPHGAALVLRAQRTEITPAKPVSATAPADLATPLVTDTETAGTTPLDAADPDSGGTVAPDDETQVPPPDTATEDGAEPATGDPVAGEGTTPSTEPTDGSTEPGADTSSETPAAAPADAAAAGEPAGSGPAAQPRH